MIRLCCVAVVAIGFAFSEGWPTGKTGRAAAASPQETIAGAARKVVKIYGAGGVRGLEAYQTGVLVSPGGHVVTVTSTVLDADELTCVLDDGRRYRATLVGVDPLHELAVLSIDAEELAAFTLVAGEPVPPGTRIFALSNLFGVAVGDERVSAQHGVVAARVPLEARRGSYEVPYRGDVYILDCTTNNPGAPGGAVIDWRGRLIGMLGKELRASTSGTWLNYALPSQAIFDGYTAIVSGTGASVVSTTSGENPGLRGTGFDPATLGLVLVPDLLDRTPPFIETVTADSPAARAGLRPDDLVVAVVGRAVASRAAVQQALSTLAAGDTVRLSVVRNGAIVECDLGPRPAGGRKR